VAADVWAFGTTLWEIFAYGECPPETSDVEKIKKVHSRACVSYSCFCVLTFLKILKLFIEYSCVKCIACHKSKQQPNKCCCVAGLPEW
jgi:hypothetical protein